ncbi:hypothetical protein AB0B85_01680, partial [Micromonospora sp. NPDC049044]|uniref:hypothetical protein n=1 Tax=Micromonospora sp. NPDC049044 TaxID=3154827 RepID=UPI0033FFDB67
MDISPILAAVLGLVATAASGTLVEWARSWLRRRSRVEVRVGDSTLQIATEVERLRFGLSRGFGVEGHAGVGEEAGEEIG